MRIKFSDAEVVFDGEILYLKVKELIYPLSPSKFGYSTYPKKLMIFGGDEEVSSNHRLYTFFLTEQGSKRVVEASALFEPKTFSMTTSTYNLSFPLFSPVDVKTKEGATLLTSNTAYVLLRRGKVMSANIGDKILASDIGKDGRSAVVVTKNTIQLVSEDQRYEIKIDKPFASSINISTDNEKGFFSVFFITDGKQSYRVGLKEGGEVLYGHRPNIFYAHKKD